jgi:hypothetical protein
MLNDGKKFGCSTQNSVGRKVGRMTEFVSDETKFVFRVNTTHPDTDGRR